MAEYLIQDTTLVGIANKVRQKTGSNESIICADIESKIDSILTPTDGSISSQAAKTITPGINNQIAVAPGVYTTGAITVSGDINLVASNIIAGKSIFGISGTAPQVITSTNEVVVGSSSSYPEGTLYVVYE